MYDYKEINICVTNNIKEHKKKEKEKEGRKLGRNIDKCVKERKTKGKS